jgi:nucleoside-diphosphate-sugar epimerase
MRILVIGAAGMLGGKLVERLVGDGRLGSERISQLTLVDLVVTKPVDDPSFVVESTAADLAEPGVAASIVASRPDVIFHLAAVVSGEAEDDLEKGYRVNLDATRTLLDAIRACDQGYRPRVVYSSSIAVFGPPLPDVIGDDHCATPATSYGTQKAMIELLLADHARRGFVDGVAVRLPTICVRPGTPNLAASGFFSSIIREPLNGRDALLPVSPDVRHWFASPRSAIGFLLHAATIDRARLDDRRCLTMPGVSATVADEIEALRRVAGEDAVRRIHHEPDEAIMRIVAGWPRAFEARRARALGFSAEADFDEIIRVYVEDELGGWTGPAGTPATGSDARGSPAATEAPRVDEDDACSNERCPHG